MTTHELANLLLKEPDVTVAIEGWTTNDIEVIRPLWCDTHREVRMLTAVQNPEVEAWLRQNPMHWMNIPATP